MADQRSNNDTANDAGTPRWVKVFGAVFVVVVVLFLILLFTRGAHRPRGHGLRGTPSGHTPGSGHR